ncbi:MAG: hypothetical protein HC887_12495 [Desulfobacteraceae bacterium]|nr:hypothetical protein [Desulfobacteraceae bacterium]
MLVLRRGDTKQSRRAFRKQCGVYRSVKPNQDLGLSENESGFCPMNKFMGY